MISEKNINKNNKNDLLGVVVQFLPKFTVYLLFGGIISDIKQEGMEYLLIFKKIFYRLTNDVIIPMLDYGKRTVKDGLI